MPRSHGDKGTPKDKEPRQKGKGGHEEGEKPPKAPEDVGALAPKNSGSESRHGSHGQKSGKKGPTDPHAAATKTYSPFLNTVFGKVGTSGGDVGMGGPWKWRGCGDSGDRGRILWVGDRSFGDMAGHTLGLWGWRGYGDSGDGDMGTVRVGTGIVQDPADGGDVEHLRHGDMETVGMGTVGLFQDPGYGRGMRKVGMGKGTVQDPVDEEGIEAVGMGLGTVGWGQWECSRNLGMEGTWDQ